MTSPADAGWTAGQYGIFRILLGAYLLVHFALLLPWSAEIFSDAGMLADGAESPLMRLFPNILRLSDAPWAVDALTVSGIFAAIGVMTGRHDRLCGLWAWYVLACLFGRNPLIANPSLPYLGFMLLAHAFVPRDGRLPRDLFLAGWIVLALSYSYSGYTKLLSPSWVSGDAIAHVLENPLARDHALRALFLWFDPWVLKSVTWGVMYVELLFAPLCLVARARAPLWALMLVAQLGFLVFLNFADLTAAMLLFHLFTLDPRWLKPRPAEAVLFYDGACGLCHRVVRLAVAEDRAGAIRFAPIQGETAAAQFDEAGRRRLEEAMALRIGNRLYERSDAYVQLLLLLGGLWRVLGWLLMAVPRPLRNGGHAMIGRVRRHLLPLPDGLCPLVPAALRPRFLP